MSLFALAGLAGCERAPEATTASYVGDLGGSILRGVARYGGRPASTNALPVFEAKWQEETTVGARYLNGREQLRIRISGDRFSELTNYLTRAYGAPSAANLYSHGNAIGGYYTIAEVGLGLQFYRDATETGLVAVGVPGGGNPRE